MDSLKIFWIFLVSGQHFVATKSTLYFIQNTSSMMMIRWFTSLSTLFEVKTKWWKEDNERLCAMKHCSAWAELLLQRDLNPGPAITEFRVGT